MDATDTLYRQELLALAQDTLALAGKCNSWKHLAQRSRDFAGQSFAPHCASQARAVLADWLAAASCCCMQPISQPRVQCLARMATAWLRHELFQREMARLPAGNTMLIRILFHVPQGNPCESIVALLMPFLATLAENRDAIRTAFVRVVEQRRLDLIALLSQRLVRDQLMSSVSDQFFESLVKPGEEDRPKEMNMILLGLAATAIYAFHLTHGTNGVINGDVKLLPTSNESLVQNIQATIANRAAAAVTGWMTRTPDSEADFEVYLSATGYNLRSQENESEHLPWDLELVSVVSRYRQVDAGVSLIDTHVLSVTVSDRRFDTWLDKFCMEHAHDILAQTLRHVAKVDPYGACRIVRERILATPSISCNLWLQPEAATHDAASVLSVLLAQSSFAATCLDAIGVERFVTSLDLTSQESKLIARVSYAVQVLLITHMSSYRPGHSVFLLLEHLLTWLTQQQQSSTAIDMAPVMRAWSVPWMPVPHMDPLISLVEFLQARFRSVAPCDTLVVTALVAGHTGLVHELIVRDFLSKISWNTLLIEARSMRTHLATRMLIEKVYAGHQRAIKAELDRYLIPDLGAIISSYAPCCQ
jgi:hypothetical protein